MTSIDKDVERRDSNEAEETRIARFSDCGIDGVSAKSDYCNCMGM